MTSPTKAVSRAHTQMLLQWMQRRQPRAYAHIVTKFAPPQQVAGLWDSLAAGAGKVVDGLTNVLNSDGAQKILGAATPFLQNKLERDQLKTNIQRVQAGFPPVDYPTGATPGYAYQFDPAASPVANINWTYVGLGVAGLAALFMLRPRR